MNNVANSKRVFYMAPHMVVGYAAILGGRGDVTLDRLARRRTSAPFQFRSGPAATHA
jgi:hypothetical protein